MAIHREEEALTSVLKAADSTSSVIVVLLPITVQQDLQDRRVKQALQETQDSLDRYRITISSKCYKNRRAIREDQGWHMACQPTVPVSNALWGLQAHRDSMEDLASLVRMEILDLMDQTENREHLDYRVLSALPV